MPPHRTQYTTCSVLTIIVLTFVSFRHVLCSLKESLKALTISPQLAAQWLINDGEYLPSHTWICPTSAAGIVPEAADAYWVCALAPKLFTRRHTFDLFFSGGYSGRTTSSFRLWDYMDRAYEDLSVDQAKVCSHDRQRVEGALDLAREDAVRQAASFRDTPDGVLRYDVDADTDEDLPVIQNASSRACPPPSATVVRGRLSQLVRTSSDNTAASADLPLVHHPKCIQAGCSREGNFGMVSCFTCGGHLHRGCGTLIDEDDEECLDRRCSSCVSARKGKSRARDYP